MNYQWDKKKAKANLLKHGVFFADAVAVFADDAALTIEDDDPDEQRFVTIGMDGFGRVLAGRRNKDNIRPPGNGAGAHDLWGIMMKKEYDFSEAKRGAIEKLPPGKTRITIRIDNEVMEWFRAKVNENGGGNYQTLINDALREHIKRGGEPLEDTLRRVLREELRKTG